MKKLITLLMAGLAWAVHGQTNAPKTWFGVYNSTMEAPIIRGMTPVGSLTSHVTYPVDIRIERLNIQPATNNIYAVALRTHLPGSTEVDYIDYDELAGVIHGLGLISSSNHDVVPMDDFEVIYRVRSGWSVTKISNGNNIEIVIKSGDANRTHNQIPPYVLDDLQRMLTSAKATIDKMVANGQ